MSFNRYILRANDLFKLFALLSIKVDMIERERSMIVKTLMRLTDQLWSQRQIINEQRL